jgi:hypothetical protein
MSFISIKCHTPLYFSLARCPAWTNSPKLLTPGLLPTNGDMTVCLEEAEGFMVCSVRSGSMGLERNKYLFI